ncbi:MAG: outer membrane lipoprotein-sorting protein [Firmicutes bacterium]|nr:outer membrane lipoprotein-sorting protein [Bacillota bacterium]
MTKHFIKGTIFLILISFLAVNPLLAATKSEGQGIIKKSQQAFYYAGKDFKARVFMKLINPQGQQRIRDLVMLRKNEPNEEQRYFIYFYEPADVRNTTFMVFKYPNKDSSRWLFIPSINMVKRIAANDKRSSFIGSDFTYEDISGRDIIFDTHTLLREEAQGGKACYVVESIPKEESEYTKKISWIDKTNFLPLKEEYYDSRGELYKVFTADEIKTVQGFPTVTRRTMKNLKSGHRTEVTFKEVNYNLGIEEDLFSERNLKNPPQRWIK